MTDIQEVLANLFIENDLALGGDGCLPEVDEKEAICFDVSYINSEQC